MPHTSPKRDQSFTPQRLVLTAIVVLTGTVVGMLVANALAKNNSSNDQAMGIWMSSYARLMVNQGAASKL